MNRRRFVTLAPALAANLPPSAQSQPLLRQQLFTFRFAAKTRNNAKRRWRISLFRMLAV